MERARYLLNTDELLEKCSIVEADDETTVAKAVVEIASRGSIKTATYKAIPIDEFIESFK
ncbi:MAG: GYD domain-containing protein [Candidatus Methanoperedens sp.]|nr:GYD domain-containing protein [Candidatus Methanoperedens sp.]